MSRPIPGMAFAMISVFFLLASQAHLMVVVRATPCLENNTQAGYRIQCKFSLNVNTTRKDFTVFYKTDDDGERPLVDCRWPGETFFCFKPQGADCERPVSEKVNIAVSGPLACKNATFSAKVFGYVGDISGTCLKLTLPDRSAPLMSQQGNAYTKTPTEADAECATRKNEERFSSVTLTCLFHHPVDSFDIVYDGRLVNSFTKKQCQTADTCLFQKDGNKEVYSLLVNWTASVEGNFTCMPRLDSLSLAVAKGCHVTTDENTPGEVNTTGIIVGVLAAVTVIAILAITVYIKRNKEKAKQWPVIKLLYRAVPTDVDP